jgi:hypothetical protein
VKVGFEKEKPKQKQKKREGREKQYAIHPSLILLERNHYSCGYG